VDVALVSRTGPSGDHTETALCRQMRQNFRPPAWGQEVSVVADAAYASRATMALIHPRGSGDVIALPRTWKVARGKALNALVTPRPRWQ
jgi:hypothetical protein